jgi:hypothetical protein
MGQYHPREYTVVDGLDRLLLLLAVVELNPIVDIQNLHDLPFCLLAICRLKQSR